MVKQYLPLAILSVLFVLLLLFLNNRKSLNFVDEQPIPTIILAPTIVQLQTYYNEKYKFQFDYPSNWILKTYNNNRDIISLKIIDDNSGIDDFSISIESSEPLSKYINKIKSDKESKNIIRKKINGQIAYYVDVCGNYCFTKLYFGNNNTLSITLGNTQNQLYISREIFNIILSFNLFPDISTWKTYKNEKYGFEFKYPSEWKIGDETFTPEYELNLRIIKNEKYGFEGGEYDKENFLNIQKNVNNQTLEQIVNKLLSESPEQYKESILKTNDKFNLIYQNIYNKTAYLLKNNLIFSISTSPFDDGYQEILSTFKFTN